MANTIISLNKASVGDAIAIQSGTTGTSSSHFVAVVGSTVSFTPPSGYIWYGVVYGKEKGGLMVAYHTTSSKKWAEYQDTGTYGNIASGASITFNSTVHSNIIDTTVGSGANMMLNGLYTTYVGMSISRVIERCNTSGNTSTLLHPLSAYEGSNPPMNKTNFDADTNGAKSLYGTYENYVAQTLPMLKGSRAGCFRHRCGWKNTQQLCNYASSRAYIANNSAAYAIFPAADYCHELRVGSESVYHWWLPDMYELAIMMRDESFAICAATVAAMGGSYGSAASHRWSSVRYDSTNAWYYYNLGVSSANYFYNGVLACPVTLLQI